MKLDKIVFSSSDEYAPFWNVQSRIWSKIGLKPVLLFYGKDESLVSSQFGTVIKREYDVASNLSWVVQLTCAKFDYPTTEPETTWLIGDIDMIPLQSYYFTKHIEAIPANAFAHLNAGGIAGPRLGKPNGFMECGSQRVCKDRGAGPGADLPGHYHAAKGKHFEIFTRGRPFIEQVRYIVESGRYGLGADGQTWIQQDRDKGFNARDWFWCAEEGYTSEMLWLELERGAIDFRPVFYNNANNTNRVDRSGWTGTDYTYSRSMVRAGVMVDVHCQRPFDAQRDALARLLRFTEFADCL